MDEYYFEVQFTCDTCEKDFFTQAHYENHMLEHRTCNLDGCTFTAHEKILEKHIRMQHSTGLYDKIRNINTPEDIAKWIEQRKKRYPNKENIEKRYKEQQEKLARGERIPRNQNRFGKDKFRLRNTVHAVAPGRTNMKPPRRKFIKKPIKSVSLINQKLDWNGSLFPFAGTSNLYKDEIEKEESDFDDDEWETSANSNKPIVKLNNALGALMGAYGSDDEFEDVIPEVKPVGQPLQTVTEVPKIVSDEEAPEEVKIDKSLTTVVEVVSSAISSQPVVQSSVEGHKRKRHRQGMKRAKNNRKFNKHNLKDRYRGPAVSNSANSGNASECTPSTSKGSGGSVGSIVNNGFPFNTFRKRKVTLLEKLLQNEIRHERNVLLQCVRHVVSNNFFKK